MCAESDVQNFVFNNFYVDDVLTSCPTEQEVIDLVQRTKQSQNENGRHRLHKIASNSRNVLQVFTTEGLAKNLTDLDFLSTYAEKLRLVVGH